MKEDRVKAIYKEVAGSYEDDLGAQMTGLWDKIINNINLTPNSRVLDLGCGTGSFIARLSQKHAGRNISFAGIDLCDEMVMAAKSSAKAEIERQGNKVEFKTKDAVRFLEESDENSYDLVITSLLLCYVRPEKIFKMIARVLKPQGIYLIVSTEREGWSEFEAEFWKFLVTHLRQIKIVEALATTATFAPRVKEMARYLNETGFKNINIENLQMEKQFDNPIDWLRWIDGVGLASNYFNYVKEGFKSYIIDEVAKYADRNKIKCYGVPIEYGKPFTFRWKILYATAER